MNETDYLAITLYVPDATVRSFSGEAGFRGVILEGAPELDFLHLGWWEGSHTARLAPWRGADSVNAQEGVAHPNDGNWLL